MCFEFSLFHPESVVTYSPIACMDDHPESTRFYLPGLHLGAAVLSHQSVYGDLEEKELSAYHVESRFDKKTAEHLLSVKIPKEKWNGKCAIKLKIVIGNRSWKNDPDPVITLGKYDISPGDFGFLMPVKNR